MTKRDLIIFLFKWEKSLFGYWFLIIGLSIFLVYSLPQKYTAVGKILIEGNRAPVMRADVAFGMEQMNVINSAVAVIRSKPVIKSTAREVERLRKENDAKTKTDDAEVEESAVSIFFGKIDQWTLDVGLRESSSARESLIRDLKDSLKIEPQANSNVIAISFKSDDPKIAANVVNSVTDNYITHHLNIYASVGTSEVYRMQIDRLEKDFNQRRQELNDYKRENSVSALKETMRAQVQQQTKLTAEIVQLEDNLAELKTRFGAGHTKVVLLQERLDAAETSLAETNNKLQALEEMESIIQNMQIELSSSQLTIQNYKQLFQDEQIVNLANPDVVNVLIIEKATIPTRPDHSRLFYILLATVGGLLLSVAIAFIKEYFDHRVTDPRVASELLGIPTLGSIEKA